MKKLGDKQLGAMRGSAEPSGAQGASREAAAEVSLARHWIFLEEESDPMRKVWWMNTVCALVLVVGLVGVEQMIPFMPKALASDVSNDLTVEVNGPDLGPPVPNRGEEDSVKNEDPTPFQLPVIPDPVRAMELPGHDGNLVEPLPFGGKGGDPERGRFQLRERPLRTSGDTPKPEEFRGYGRQGKHAKQGYVPEPDVADMPRSLQDELPRGTVSMKLSFRVSAGGKIVEIHVDESSGSRRLDRFMMDWYKRKGTFLGGNAERLFVETLSLKLPE